MESTKERINFYGDADFPDLLGRTFRFFSREFVNLVKILLVFVVPILLVNFWFSQKAGLQQILNEALIAMQKQDFSQLSTLFNRREIWVSYILSLLESVLMTSSIIAYIKLYIDEETGNFNLQSLWEQVKKYFFSVLGLQLLVGLVVLLGILLCILPGIYLLVVFFPAAPALILENNGIRSALARSFELTKGNWFTSFIALLAILLITVVGNVLTSSIFTIMFAAFGKGGAVESISQLAFNSVQLLISALSVIVSVALYASFVAQSKMQ